MRVWNAWLTGRGYTVTPRERNASMTGDDGTHSVDVSGSFDAVSNTAR